MSTRSSKNKHIQTPTQSLLNNQINAIKIKINQKTVLPTQLETYHNQISIRSKPTFNQRSRSSSQNSWEIPAWQEVEPHCWNGSISIIPIVASIISWKYTTSYSAKWKRQFVSSLTIQIYWCRWEMKIVLSQYSQDINQTTPSKVEEPHHHSKYKLQAHRLIPIILLQHQYPTHIFANNSHRFKPIRSIVQVSNSQWTLTALQANQIHLHQSSTETTPTKV